MFNVVRKISLVVFLSSGFFSILTGADRSAPRELSSITLNEDQSTNSSPTTASNYSPATTTTTPSSEQEIYDQEQLQFLEIIHDEDDQTQSFTPNEPIAVEGDEDLFFCGIQEGLFRYRVLSGRLEDGQVNEFKSLADERAKERRNDIERYNDDCLKQNGLRKGSNHSRFQHAYKHARDFDLEGGKFHIEKERFFEKIKKHVETAPLVIVGHYKNKESIHYFDQDSALCVTTDMDGNLRCCFRLGQKQIEYLLRSGHLK